jgi:hypothetical protein
MISFYIPAALFAGTIKIGSGYELYSALKGLDNPKSVDDGMRAMVAVGYLDGFLDSLRFMEDFHYESMFPKNAMSGMSEWEREQVAKQLGFRRLKFPPEGIPVEQFIMIFKKYAERDHSKLNGTARVCLLESLVMAFGWK